MFFLNDYWYGFFIGQLILLLTISMLLRIFIFSPFKCKKDASKEIYIAFDKTDIKRSNQNENAKNDNFKKGIDEGKFKIHESCNWLNNLLSAIIFMKLKEKGSVLIRSMIMRYLKYFKNLKSNNQSDAGSSSFLLSIESLDIEEIVFGSQDPKISDISSNSEIVNDDMKMNSDDNSNLELQLSWQDCFELKMSCDLGLCWNTLSNVPMVILPCHLTIKLVSLSCKINIKVRGRKEKTNEQEACDDHVTLCISKEDFNLKFDIESRIGSRKTLNNPPKLKIFLENFTREFIENFILEPKEFLVQIPILKSYHDNCNDNKELNMAYGL